MGNSNVNVANDINKV